MGGGSTQKGTVGYDPNLMKLEEQRAGLAGNLLQGGIPAGLQGVLEKTVIPSTMNTLTAGGLGRSGAAGEAVAQASLGQVTGLIQSLLTGVPQAAAGMTKQTTTKEPGVFDYLRLVGDVAGGFCWHARAVFGGECVQIQLVRGWLYRHPRWARWYARTRSFAPLLAPLSQFPLRWIVRRMVRRMA
jgi:hypothetical protein